MGFEVGAFWGTVHEVGGHPCAGPLLEGMRVTMIPMVDVYTDEGGPFVGWVWTNAWSGHDWTYVSGPDPGRLTLMLESGSGWGLRDFVIDLLVCSKEPDPDDDVSDIRNASTLVGSPDVGWYIGCCSDAASGGHAPGPGMGQCPVELIGIVECQ